MSGSHLQKSTHIDAYNYISIFAIQTLIMFDVWCSLLYKIDTESNSCIKVSYLIVQFIKGSTRVLFVLGQSYLRRYMWSFQQPVPVGSSLGLVLIRRYYCIDTYYGGCNETEMAIIMFSWMTRIFHFLSPLLCFLPDAKGNILYSFCLNSKPFCLQTV